MAWTRQTAANVATALDSLDRMAKDTGLHVGTDGLSPALVDADGNTVCRLDHDAELGQHISREAL